MTYQSEYIKWANYEKLDSELKKELDSMSEKDKEEAFSGLLQFGTAGLRGILGAGTNRMNRYVVALATQGLCEVIKKHNGEKNGVVIAYDSRKYSDVFAREAAAVLAGNGIRVYLFESLRPVPELSFAVREEKATAGIVITASHNPACYNGYKVYWSDGCQLPPESAKSVHESMLSADIFNDVIKDENSSLITVVGKEIDEKYYKAVLNLRLCKEEAAKTVKNLKIVYTPLHGAGNIPVREVLKRAGFENVTVVKEQENPDPDFSTVKSPNPEDKAGFEIAFGYADDIKADIVIGTDPDCDRVGVAVPDSFGGYVSFSGNQIGVLLTDYILNSLKERGKLPKNGAVISSIVSTKMVDPICREYGIKLFNVLTGFKYIGGKIDEFDKTGNYTFLFGFEESCGYLSGKHARDKDGVNASLLICEMAAVYKAKGISLLERLEQLYKKYGYYNENVISITLSGLEGMAKIKNIMKSLRDNPIQILNGAKAVGYADLLNGLNGLPPADVLRYDFDDDTTVFVRPSGTEPKIKGYIMTKSDSYDEALKKGKEIENELRKLIK